MKANSFPIYHKPKYMMKILFKEQISSLTKQVEKANRMLKEADFKLLDVHEIALRAEKEMAGAYMLPAIRLTAEGFEQGAASQMDMEKMAARGLVDRLGNSWDFTKLNASYCGYYGLYVSQYVMMATKGLPVVQLVKKYNAVLNMGAYKLCLEVGAGDWVAEWFDLEAGYKMARQFEAGFSDDELVNMETFRLHLSVYIEIVYSINDVSVNYWMLRKRTRSGFEKHRPFPFDGNVQQLCAKLLK